jgi:hypothetical protein
VRICSVGRLALTVGVLGVLPLAGCGGEAPAAPTETGSPTPVATAPSTARARLAARAAAAQDRRMVASYRLSTPDLPDRTVSVTLAIDGTWRVDVAHGALGATTDVAVARSKEGLHQCALAAAGQPAPSSQPPSSQPVPAGQSAPAGCVRVTRLGSRYDPRVQHVFTDWLAALTDQRAALAVSPAKAIKDVRGECFSVESSSASLPAPLDLGIYCFDQDGTLTGAALGFGTLVLDGAPGPAPATVSLPGPVVTGTPLPMASPSPSAPASPSGSPSAAQSQQPAG